MDLTRLVPPLCFMVAAASGATGQQEKKQPVQAHPKVDQKKVDEAIGKGIEYLKGAYETDRNAGELVLWTFLHAGVPEEGSHFQALFKKMIGAKLYATYNVSLQAMILEKMDRVKYQERIYHCAQYLVDNQWDYGQWGYGEPTTLTDPPKGVPTGDRPKTATAGSKRAVEFDEKKVRMRLKVTRNPAHTPVRRGDDSNSQYAALGLRACHDAGIIIPEETIALAQKWWRENQMAERERPNDPKSKDVATGMGVEPAGWGYFPEGKKSHWVYGSMTVGGLAALTIFDYLQGKTWKNDPNVLAGVNWMTKNFSVTENPKGGNKAYLYYMYGLERAGILFGTEWFGVNEWYPLGANHLMSIQRADGSWDDGNKSSAVVDTCFAILFLRRATRPLTDVASVDKLTPEAKK